MSIAAYASDTNWFQIKTNAENNASNELPQILINN